jgi:hyaluronan synthase
MSYQQISRIQEMSKSRWLVRYLILIAVGAVVAVKLYLVIFVVDLLVGLYSITTVSVLFAVLMCTFLKFKDPYLNAQEKALLHDKPLVTIIVAVKNEEDNIRNCVQAILDSTYPNREILIVNDGSTDRTASILDEMRKNSDIKVIHLSRNIGKKKAIKAATDIAKGEIFIMTDSDITIYPDAIEKTVELFQSDRTIGAVTAHGRVRGAAEGNALKKIQDVWYDGQYRILKGMEGSFSSLTCCSGAYTAYRKAAVIQHMNRWANDRFAGVEFKFCTDRLLTSFVLASGPPPVKGKQGIVEKSNALTMTDNDSLEAMKSTSDPDVASDRPKTYWKIVYSPSIKVLIGPPETFRALIMQQIRWRKSFIRSIFATGSVYWRRPKGAAIIYYLHLGLKIVRPFVVLKALILLPLQGDLTSAAFYITGVLFVGMIYGVEFRLRNPGNSRWLYRPIMTLMSTFILTWLLPYAAITIRKSSWR